MDSTPSSPTTSRPPTPVGELPDNINTAKPFRFNWDPSTSKRRGPESISATTEGRADYVRGPPPRFDFLNASTSNLASVLTALPQDWSSSRHGFHAISTVLNNPHKKQAPPKAHSSLPTVAPTDLPRVRRKDFDSYLRAITPAWEQYQRNCHLGSEGVAQLDGPTTPRLPPGRNIPELDTVPAVFFDPSFDLGVSRTFDLVTERSDHDEDGDNDPSSLSHSLPLLEKLSHYADTVEQHLVREISLRSTSFFAALTNLHELQSESEQCLDRTAKLRKLLHDVDEKSAKRGLDIVRKEFKLRNLEGVKEGVRAIEEVVDMTEVAKGLVTAGQWDRALGAIEEMEQLWGAGQIQSKTNGRVLTSPNEEEEDDFAAAVQRKPPIPISSLHAFSALPNHLRVLTMEITSSLITELVHLLQVDLVDRMNEDTPGDSLNQTLRDRLKPLLNSLSRTKGLKDAVLSWREVALGEVRKGIKKYIPLFEDNDEEKTTSTAESSSETRPGLGNHLRQMSHPEFLTLMRSVYKSFLNGVRGTQTQSNIFVEVLQGIQSSEITLLQEEFTDLMCSAGELSNMQASKLVSRRSEQHAVLSLLEFHAFFTESWDFVVQCEVICRRMIVGLRGVVVSQAKVFLQTFHQDRISRSAKFVEDEQWAPVDVAAASQKIVDIIVESAVRDPIELNFAHGVPQVNGSSSGSSKHLKVEDRSYFAVQATLEVIYLVRDYLQVIVNLSMLTTESMSRIIEFLKAFNSRTCQVVLGAGAMRSAGLKNITAKHLALASQSLSIMISLIPYIREAFRRHLNTMQAVMLVEFDKLKRDYQEHQNEIHGKLIAIMGDRLSAHIKTLQSVEWSKSANGVNDYMILLVKETVTLHKVLSRYLYAPVVEYVMTQVFAAINHRLSEEYSKIELPNQEAKTRLLADAQYLQQKLSVLKNVSLQSGMLETVISEKKVAQQSPPQAAAAAPAPVGRSNTISSANQRLKGLLSGSKTLLTEKALPVPMANAPPTPITASPTPPPPPAKPNGSIVPVDHHAQVPSTTEDTDRSKSPVMSNDTPLPPPVTRTSSFGFREIVEEPEGMAVQGESEAAKTESNASPVPPPRAPQTSSNELQNRTLTADPSSGGDSAASTSNTPEEGSTGQVLNGSRHDDAEPGENGADAVS